MALLGMDGCDGMVNSDPGIKEDPLWLDVGTSNLTAGRFGGGAFTANSSTWRRMIPSMSGSVFRHRWSQYAAEVRTVGNNLTTLHNNNGADLVCELEMVSNLGNIRLRDSAGNIVSGSETAVGVMKGSMWQDVEMVVTVNGTTGACMVWVDNILVINVTNQDFSITNTDVDIVRYYDQAASGNSYYDDFVWCDGSAGLGDAFIGDHRIMPLEADADGDQTAWTRNGEAGSDYENVNDPLTTGHTGDADYLSATGGSDLAFTVNLESLPSTPAGILAVRAVHVVRKDDGGTPAGAVKPRMRHSGSEIDGAAFVLSTNWQRLSQYSEDVPGGSGWTEAQVNALQLGLFYDVP